MIRAAFLALFAMALLGSAIPDSLWAQTPGPTPDQIVRQQQADLNRFQSQLQADQLQQLQRQNSVNLQQPDPNARAQAAERQWEIQKQIDQTTALQQQMSTPSANPADVHARLQQNGAQIDQLQQQPVPSPSGVR